MKRYVLFPGALLAAAWCLSPTAARAQSETDLAARRTLLDEAQSARAAGDHARALDRAQRGATIQETPSVRLFIAEEQEALGQFAAALGSGDRCGRAAERDASVPHRDEVIARCNAVASRARSHIGYLVLHVPASPPSGARITVNGAPVAEALWGAPVPVDPGSVRVEMQAGDRDARVVTVRVATGARAEVPVEFAAATGTATATTQVSQGAQGTAATPAPTPAPATESSSGVPIGAVTVAVLGVLSFGAAGVFGVLRNDALTGCTVENGVGYCDSPEHQQNAQSNGVLFNDAADVALIAGGVLLAGGVVWFAVDRLTAGPPERHGARRTVVPVVGLGFAGVRGTF